MEAVEEEVDLLPVHPRARAEVCERVEGGERPLDGRLRDLEIRVQEQWDTVALHEAQHEELGRRQLRQCEAQLEPDEPMQTVHAARIDNFNHILEREPAKGRASSTDGKTTAGPSRLSNTDSSIRESPKHRKL
jgi:hypothetical protein